jgi:hypothetical protein
VKKNEKTMAEIMKLQWKFMDIAMECHLLMGRNSRCKSETEAKSPPHNLEIKK